MVASVLDKPMADRPSSAAPDLGTRALARHNSPMPMPPPPDLSALDPAELIRLASGPDLPPVDRWHPAHCGDSAMRIARDGTWWHMDSPIQRPAMVRLFSRLLRREADGSHVLVTPVERLAVAVEDTPFLAVALRIDGAGRDATVAFQLNTGEVAVADAEHPIAVRGSAAPVVTVRHQANGPLLAALTRPVWMELAEHALAEGGEPPAVWSRGHRLALT